MQNRNVFYHFILMGILFLCLFTASNQAQEACEAASGDALELGAIFPQGVLLLSDTSEWWRGTESMTAAINACGGVNGRPVTYHYEEAATYEEALEAFDILEAESLPLIVASGFAPVNQGLMQAAEEAGIVLWEVTERPTEQANRWTFYAHPSPGEVGAELAEYVQNTLIPSLGISDVRLAFIHESRPRAAEIAAAFRQGLAFSPIIDEVYENELSNAYPLAVEMRESEINLLIVISFHNDADRLWNAMLQADTNVEGWLHVSGRDYHNNLTARIGNSESLLLAGADGLLLDSFPAWIDAPIYERYEAIYQENYGETPNIETNLSALGTYILLRNLLPLVNYENITAATIHAMLEANPRGSWWDSDEAAVYVEQNQYGLFCTLAPTTFATCHDDVLPFPTWRQRVRDN